MYSRDIANIFIAEYGSLLQLTNLRLNKLVYFTQVEALRTDGSPVFSDDIEAWEDGPIEPLVYQTFRNYGREIINQPSDRLITDIYANELVHTIATTYGRLSAFDLIAVSRRDRGAWKKAYMPGSMNTISILDIEQSTDIKGFDAIGESFSQKVERIKKSIPNTLRLLENS